MATRVSQEIDCLSRCYAARCGVMHCCARDTCSNSVYFSDGVHTYTRSVLPAQRSNAQRRNTQRMCDRSITCSLFRFRPFSLDFCRNYQSCVILEITLYKRIKNERFRLLRYISIAAISNSTKVSVINQFCLTLWLLNY